MKILAFSNCDLVLSQGSGYVIINYARGLSQRGHDVVLVAPGETMLWPRVGKARSFRLALGLWRKAPRFIRAARPDLVEFWGAEGGWAVRRLRRSTRRQFKMVARSNGIESFVAETLANHGVPNTATGAPRRWYQGGLPVPRNDVFRWADAIITVSEAEAVYARECCFQPDDRVLGIDNALPSEFLEQPFERERPKTIGYCGSWLARKGVEFMAAALSAVLREHPDWTLHLVGVGAGFRAERHFSPEVLAQVKVTGFVVDKGELRNVYRTWSIALQPSIYESFGLAAVEAMACGCALVSTPTGFAASLRDRSEVWLVRPEAAALSEALRLLIVKGDLRSAIAERGQASVQRLQWACNVERLEAFYRRLTSPA